jgi:hypothetical protein
LIKQPVDQSLLIDDLRGEAVRLVELEAELKTALATNEKKDTVISKLQTKIKQLEYETRAY